jgi:hypothetical protein
MGASIPRRRPRAMVLVEAVVLLCIVVLLVGAMALLSADSRRRACLAGSAENLQQFASGTAAYGGDNIDLVPMYSWRAGIDYGFGGIATTDVQAAANQAIDIIRRRTGRTDILTIANWVPHLLFSHLILQDYLQQPLPRAMVVSPGDLYRLSWQRDPLSYTNLVNRPSYPATDNTTRRWPYSSSYELGRAFMAQDAGNAQGTTINETTAGTLPIGGRLLSEVRYPSNKAMWWERDQRFFGPRVAFFAYDEARVPVLFVDGSVSVRSTSDCNQGFRPNSPTSGLPTTITYAPDVNFEPPTLAGTPTEAVIAHMRYTRSGMRGRDFAGPEVPWPPP